MDYSLSDIQLPEAPKEKNSKTKSSRGGRRTSSRRGKKSAVREESPSLEDEREKEEANGFCKIRSASPQTRTFSEASEESCSAIPTPAEKVVNVSSENPSKKEERKINDVVLSNVKEEKCNETESNKESNTVSETTPITQNCQLINDVEVAKERSLKKMDKKSNSTDKTNKMKGVKSKKLDSVIKLSKRKSSRNVDSRSDTDVEEKLGKKVRQRKNRRTRRSGSQSSSTDSSTIDGGSPNRVSPRSKKHKKSSSSSEEIASPRPAPCSSGSDTEIETTEEISADQPAKMEASEPTTVESSVGGVKPRRKLNRSLSVKSCSKENNVKKETEELDSINESSVITQDEKKAEISDDTKCDVPKDNVIKKSEVREVKFTPRKLSLSSGKSTEKQDQDAEKSDSKLVAKKRKWGSCAATLPRASVSISSDSLKSLMPDLKPFSVPPVLSDQEDLSNPDTSESPPKKEHTVVNLPTVVNEAVEQKGEHIPIHFIKLEKTFKVEKAKQPSDEQPASVSPPRNPSSKVLFIQNLVRPFTLLQLKELLKQTGDFTEEHFWIDKIKSKCIVMYDTEEQAVKTRNVLHGKKWPLSNPKILSVDFSTEEELDAHRNMNEQPPKPAKAIQPFSFEKKEVKVEQVDVPKRREREESRREREEGRREREEGRREKEHPKLSQSVTHVREWDKDKLTQDSPDETSHQRLEKELEKGRLEKKKEKKESKRRVDDDAPAKLLDDLFRKTKASPCIYWLPLTEEQAKKRDEGRRLRRLEREKKFQQQKEQEEAERRNRTRGYSGRDKESRRSQSRSRSPQGRRR